MKSFSSRPTSGRRLYAPGAAARPRAVRAASFARRVVSKPGQALPPPTGTAARPFRFVHALHTGGGGILQNEEMAADVSGF